MPIGSAGLRHPRSLGFRSIKPFDSPKRRPFKVGASSRIRLVKPLLISSAKLPKTGVYRPQTPRPGVGVGCRDSRGVTQCPDTFCVGTLPWLPNLKVFRCRFYRCQRHCSPGPLARLPGFALEGLDSPLQTTPFFAQIWVWDMGCPWGGRSNPPWAKPPKRTFFKALLKLFSSFRTTKNEPELVRGTQGEGTLMVPSPLFNFGVAVRPPRQGLLRNFSCRKAKALDPLPVAHRKRRSCSTPSSRRCRCHTST